MTQAEATGDCPTAKRKQCLANTSQRKQVLGHIHFIGNPPPWMRWENAITTNTPAQKPQHTLTDRRPKPKVKAAGSGKRYATKTTPVARMRTGRAGRSTGRPWPPSSNASSPGPPQRPGAAACAWRTIKFPTLSG